MKVMGILVEGKDGKEYLLGIAEPVNENETVGCRV